MKYYHDILPEVGNPVLHVPGQRAPLTQHGFPQLHGQDSKYKEYEGTEHENVAKHRKCVHQ